MEKEKELRIASVLITIEKNSSEVADVNKVLSNYSAVILARQGLSLPNRDFNIITLIFEAEVNTINSFAGKIGRIPKVCIKVLMTKK